MNSSRTTSDQSPHTVYSIGHSNHDESTFVGLLRTHAIDVLVDVRSQPYCRFATHFNAEAIKHVVAEAGARYVFLGRELGGRPTGDQFYDAAGHVLYGVVAQSPPFLQGIERLIHSAANGRAAMMCSEENPAVCHRHLLIGRVLDRQGIHVLHIRGDGRLQTYADIEQSRGGRQGFLFQDLEADSWKSLRSVLHKLQPPSSSSDCSEPESGA